MKIFRRRDDAAPTRPRGRHRAPTRSAAVPAEPSGPPPARDDAADVPELGLLALEHALRSVVPDGGPLVPFALLETADGRSLTRFAGDLVQGQEHARHHVRAAAGVTCAAIAWDGYLTVEGVRSDAVFVEVSAPGQPSIVMAHRYLDRPGTAEAIGGPVRVERGGPLM